LDASSRFAYTNEQVKKKPGREVVTFLLVCNLAMWAINTLETNRADSHPIQVFSRNFSKKSAIRIFQSYFHFFRLNFMVENGLGQ